MYLAILLICILYPLSISNSNKKVCINKEKSYSIRGILAILIVLSHCSYWLPEGELNLSLVHDVGPWVCGIFFLMSGYGMFIQKNKIQQQDFLSYFKSRISKILYDFLIISLVYVSLLVATGNFVFLTMIHQLLEGNTDSLLPYCWFIIVLLIDYVLIFFVFKNKIHEFYIWVFCLIILSIEYLMGWPLHWYSSFLCFPLGVTISKYREELPQRLFISIVSLFAIILALTSLHKNSNIYDCIKIPIISLSLTVSLSNIPSLLSKIIMPLSKYSFYIYMFQGFFIKIFLKDRDITDLDYAAITVFGSIIIGIVYYYIRMFIVKHIRFCGNSIQS